jgi:hypothetical protein
MARKSLDTMKKELADLRAIEMWRAAHPAQSCTLPDHADLVVWLLEQLDSVRAALAARSVDLAQHQRHSLGRR